MLMLKQIFEFYGGQTNMSWAQFVLCHHLAMCIKPNKAQSQHREQLPVRCIHWIMTGDVIDLM
jgi:hypothetical protein